MEWKVQLFIKLLHELFLTEVLKVVTSLLAREMYLNKMSFFYSNICSLFECECVAEFLVRLDKWHFDW